MHTTIDFLRHGDVNGAPCYRGITDDPLSELGWRQMNESTAHRHWDHIISSPLQRCLSFAQKLHQEKQIPLSVETGWQEINFGDWEGKRAEQIDEKDLSRFYRDPLRNTPINGENFADFLDRIRHNWKSIQLNHPGQHILVVTHAGVIRSLFPLLLELPLNNIFNLQLDHASLTRFQCFQNETETFINLVFHNLTQPAL